ncbi:MAG: methyltransferase [Wenzhouxiangellaceae bacterium]
MVAVLNLNYTLNMLRGYFVSHTIHECFKIGLFEYLKTETTFEDLSNSLRVDEERLMALMGFLHNENIISVVRGNNFILTNRGYNLIEQRGWFELFVGGYNAVLTNLHNLIESGSIDDIRNIESVTLGSGEIFAHDAKPLVLKLMEQLEDPIELILDIGCGNGAALVSLCEELDVNGIGVDAAESAINNANCLARSKGLNEKVEFLVGDAAGLQEFTKKPDVIIAAFLLQELIPSLGELGLINYLTELASRWPNAYWIIIEVDHQPNSQVMQTLHGSGYYNGYYMLHPFTNQQLLSRDAWLEIFESAGFVTEQALTTDHAIDPTGLELGFLLSSKRPSTI